MRKYLGSLFLLLVYSGISLSAGFAGAADKTTQSQVINITSPKPGVVIEDYEVLVTGQVSHPSGAEVGVTINGFVAMHHGGKFATVVHVDPRTPPTNLTATVRDPSGAILGEHSIPITFKRPADLPDLAFKATPALGVGPHAIYFTLNHRRKGISLVELDLDGDGTVDFRSGTLDGQTFQLRAPGLYEPVVRVTDNNGGMQTAKALVWVFDQKQLDALLQAKWKAMKNALRAGNVALAVSYIAANKRSVNQNVFEALTIPLADIDQVLTDITFVMLSGAQVEYSMIYTQGGREFSGLVTFILDTDGIWRISFF